MKPTIWNSIMQSLARIIPAMKMNTRKTVAGSVTHRRVEITVERESVSIWMRGPSSGGAAGVGAVNASFDCGNSSRSGSKEEPTR